MIVEPNNSNIANHTVSNSKQNNIASAAAPVVENNINNVVSRDDTTTVSDRAKNKLNDVKKGIAAREFNKQLRVSIVKEVRKPGKSKLIPKVAGDACTYREQLRYFYRLIMLDCAGFINYWAILFSITRTP